ncbi:MAG: hypothetical protein LC715_02465, partial [Gammaproteobacteria bacterium]|nr:hypothetical protein [Gammaproteobacteria bacterium]
MRPHDFLGLGVFSVLLALASLGGWLGPVDGRLFDLAIRALPGEPPSTVAVVRVDERRRATYTDTLRRAGAIRLVDIAPEELQTLRRAEGFAATAATRCQPPAADGVVRVLRLRDAAGRPCPLARLAAAAGLSFPDTVLLSPDFSARTSTSIPRVDAASVAGDTTLRTALQGRIVIRVPTPDAPALVTPLYAADGLLEPSMPYAMALDALARGRA